VKPEDTDTLVKYRLEQAQVALNDAKYLLDGGRSPQSIINRAYYAMFYAVVALLQKSGLICSGGRPCAARAFPSAWPLTSRSARVTLKAWRAGWDAANR